MRALWAAGVLALSFAAYSPALRGQWLWDDGDYIVENPHLTQAGGLRRIWTVGQTHQYYPVTYTTFWLERRLWGLEPTGYHVLNVALHLLNALLAGMILARLGLPGAWLAAALFALHPVHVESVAWITERKNVLSGAFYLLSMLLYLRFEEERRARWYLGALAAFAAALLSKSVACSLPAALLIVRWYRRRPIGPREWRELLPFFALGAAMSFVTVWVETLRVGAGGPDFALTLLQRILVACRALWFYAGKLVWPEPLIFSYPKWTVDPGSPLQWLPVAGLAAVAAVLWRRRRAERGAPAALAFFAMTLIPALGFFTIYPQRYSYVADHFQYLASLGVLALAAALLHKVSRSRRWPAVVLAAALAAATWRQAHAYRSRETLWADTLAKNPRSFLALTNYGLVLHEQGRLAEATVFYLAALKLKPDLIEAQNNLANALAAQSRLAEAEHWYRRALLIQPDYPEASNNLGLVLARLERWKEAERCYHRAIALKPGLTGAYYNLGVALEAQGNDAGAIGAFETVLRARPDYAPARERLEALRGKRRR